MRVGGAAPAARPGAASNNFSLQIEICTDRGGMVTIKLAVSGA